MRRSNLSNAPVREMGITEYWVSVDLISKHRVIVFYEGDRRNLACKKIDVPAEELIAFIKRYDRDKHEAGRKRPSRDLV